MQIYFALYLQSLWMLTFITYEITKRREYGASMTNIYYK